MKCKILCNDGIDDCIITVHVDFETIVLKSKVIEIGNDIFMLVFKKYDDSLKSLLLHKILVEIGRSALANVYNNEDNYHILYKGKSKLTLFKSSFEWCDKDVSYYNLENGMTRYPIIKRRLIMQQGFYEYNEWNYNLQNINVHEEDGKLIIARKFNEDKYKNQCEKELFNKLISYFKRNYSTENAITIIKTPSEKIVKIPVSYRDYNLRYELGKFYLNIYNLEINTQTKEEYRKMVFWVVIYIIYNLLYFFEKFTRKLK